MKKFILFTLSLFFISLLVFTLAQNESEFEIKRNTLIDQAAHRDISHLLVLKEAPIRHVINHYQFKYFGESSYLFRDQYKFQDSFMKGIGISAMVTYSNSFNQTEDEESLFTSGTKIRFKEVDAYLNNSEIFNEDKMNYYVIEQLSFTKDNISYLVSMGYIYDGQRKNKIDFIEFLNKNLVPIGK